MEAFFLFNPAAIWNSWTVETNRYAAKTLAEKPSTMTWTPVIMEEIMAYVGMLIAMGVVSLPCIDDFFATEPILSHPWFPSILSRDRFSQINRYFHACNDLLYPGDKLGKVRTVIDEFQRNFKKYWNGHREVSIDEQLLGTRCRIGFVQYMPKKPVRFGVKIWVLADSKQPYVMDFQIYTGKDERTPEEGLANRVIEDLLSPLYDRGHILYTDNFYSNPLKFLDLENKGTLAVGTVRNNRIGMPDAMRHPNVNLQRGQSEFLKTGNLTAVHWKDKRDVYALSTAHGNEVSEVMPFKPHLIVDYNMHMNGVDRNDQLLSYYSMNRKTLKWWKKVFWRLIEMALINAFLIFKFQRPDTSHKRFRLDLAYNLAQPIVDARTIGRSLPGPGRSPAVQSDRLSGKHFPTASRKGAPRKRCKVCAFQKTPSGRYKDTKTATLCERCNVHLCAGECFKIYHTKTKF